jgi:hypothetical protein
MWIVDFLSQIALITEKATFNDIRIKGFAQTDCAFAGHSLGEYSDVLHISALVDVVFCLGITMLCAVEHDSENRSDYAMCAVVSWSTVRLSTPRHLRLLRPAPAPAPEPASDPRWSPCPPTPLPIPLDDVLHNPDPRRDRTNDRGGSLCTGQGIANLGCLFNLTSGNP